MTAVQPVIHVLTPEQINTVHQYALKILAEIGVRVDWAEARERLAAAGGIVQPDNRVFLTESMVSEAISSAPETATLYDRKGREAFTLGASEKAQTRFGVGCTNLYYQDPLTDAPAPFELAHVSEIVRLANRLPNFDLISTPGIATDKDPKTADLQVTAEMVANTTKPLVLLVSEHELFDTVFDLATHLCPQNNEKPFAIPYVNPISPLVMNKETLQKMVSAIQRGLPIIYNNYGMSGATTPITPGGTLAMLTAELLAGLTFAQVVRPATPVILGSLPAGFDMRSMISIYTPGTVLLNLASAEMMAHYRLPHSGTSGSGPGWGTDLIAGGAFWLNHLAACMGKVGLAPFVGGNLDSMAFSPTAVVYADEVIHQARMYTAGFDLNDETVALDQIAAIGPAGNFLESKQTFQLFRDIPSQSKIWPMMSLDQWQKEDCPKAETHLREHTMALLKEAAGPDDLDRLRTEARKFIEHMN